MSGIDRWILPPERFAFGKNFPVYRFGPAHRCRSPQRNDMSSFGAKAEVLRALLETTLLTR
jgi:hypothetical protein